MTFDLAPGAVALLVTYALHSTACFALVVVLLRVVPRWSARGAERLWRAALVGSLLTATLPSLVGFEPLGGRLSFVAATPAMALPDVAVTVPRGVELAARGAPALDAGAVQVAVTDLAAPRSRGWLGALVPAVLIVWAAGAALGLGRLVAARIALARLLASRRALAFGPAARALQRVARGLPRTPRLSRSSELAVPIAFGLRRPEICLPERALVELGPDELEAALAHELGHLVRRDPWWLFLGHLLGALLWFQPLVRLARRELARLAEIEADAFAARRTGAPLALAGALTRVATWWRPAGVSLAAHAMAGPRFALGERVERLLDGRASNASRGRRGEATCAALALAAVAWCAPALVAEGAASATAAPIAPAAPAPAANAGALVEIDLALAALARDAADLDRRLAARSGRDAERATLRVLERRLDRLELLREELEVLLTHRDQGAPGSRAADVPRRPAAPDAAELPLR